MPCVLAFTGTDADVDAFLPPTFYSSNKKFYLPQVAASR